MIINIAAEGAGNGRQHVRRRHDAFEMAIFIMHQRHRDIGIAQRIERFDGIHHVGQHRCLPRQRRQIKRLAFDQRLHHVARLQHADDVVHAAARHQDAAVRGGREARAHHGFIGLGIDPFDFAARCHHAAYPPIGQAHDAGNHVAFLGVDHAGGGGFGHDGAQLFFRHRLVALAALAQHAEDEMARPVEQPHERRGDAREQHHDRRHPHGNGFGAAQRELLWHEFADNQRQIGGDHDHHGKAGFFGQMRRQAKPQRQPIAHRHRQRGTGIGTVDDAHQSDADLHARQEAVRILGQRQRGAGTAGTPFSQSAQPRPPGRDDGEFRHGKKAVEQDQASDDRGVQPGEGGHRLRAHYAGPRCPLRRTIGQSAGAAKGGSKSGVNPARMPPACRPPRSPWPRPLRSRLRSAWPLSVAT